MNNGWIFKVVGGGAILGFMVTATTKLWESSQGVDRTLQMVRETKELIAGSFATKMSLSKHGVEWGAVGGLVHRFEMSQQSGQSWPEFLEDFDAKLRDELLRYPRASGG